MVEDFISRIEVMLKDNSVPDNVAARLKKRNPQEDELKLILGSGEEYICFIDNADEAARLTDTGNPNNTIAQMWALARDNEQHISLANHVLDGMHMTLPFSRAALYTAGLEIMTNAIVAAHNISLGPHNRYFANLWADGSPLGAPPEVMISQNYTNHAVYTGITLAVSAAVFLPFMAARWFGKDNIGTKLKSKGLELISDGKFPLDVSQAETAEADYLSQIKSRLASREITSEKDVIKLLIPDYNRWADDSFIRLSVDGIEGLSDYLDEQHNITLAGSDLFDFQQSLRGIYASKLVRKKLKRRLSDTSDLMKRLGSIGDAIQDVPVSQSDAYSALELGDLQYRQRSLGRDLKYAAIGAFAGLAYGALDYHTNIRGISHNVPSTLLFFVIRYSCGLSDTYRDNFHQDMLTFFGSVRPVLWAAGGSIGGYLASNIKNAYSALKTIFKNSDISDYRSRVLLKI